MLIVRLTAPVVSSLPSGAPRLSERGLPAHLQGPLRVQGAVKLNDLGHESGPSGLVAGAQPGAIVAMEVFIEENVVAPVGIALEFIGAPIDGSSAVFVQCKYPAKSICDLLAHVEKVH